MEAKLAQLATLSSPVPSSSSAPSVHPSLPAKPNAATVIAAQQSGPAPKRQKVMPPTGSTLEQVRRALATVSPAPSAVLSKPPLSATSGVAKKPPAKISGIKLVKKAKLQGEDSPVPAPSVASVNDASQS
jgi:hypothetical protein